MTNANDEKHTLPQNNWKSTKKVEEIKTGDDK